MASLFRSFAAIAVMATAFVVSAKAQDLSRELKLPSGTNLNIINKYGRVSVLAPDKAPETATDDVLLSGSSAKGVVDAEIKQSSDKGVLVLTVIPSEKKKRVDISLTVPYGAKITIETTDGAVDVAGRFARLDISTETGTIATNIPTSDVTYQFNWTESRPRVVSDVKLSDIKERSGGRFEIKGKIDVQGPKSKDQSPKTEDEDPSPKTQDQSSALHFTTARGIILVNVPPSEVGSDLRERPLTNAAKAIVRSGDGLLMEAIRRAAPRYYGEYAASLPPMKMEPRFAAKAGNSDSPAGEMKEALVRVTDLKNRAIPGLTAADFEVTESGKVREIVSVTPSTAAFNLVLLLDVSGSVENYQTFIRKAARAFF